MRRFNHLVSLAVQHRAKSWKFALKHFSFSKVTELSLLGGLATAKTSTELHGCRARAGGSSLVLTSWCLPVGGSVTLGLVTTGPGGGSARWASVTTRQGALEGGGDNLRGKVKVVPQVLNALVCKVPVIVAPGELLLHIPTGLEASQSLDHLQVGDRFELRVLGGVEILLGHHHSLLEEVLVDGHTVLLGHQHFSVLTLLLLRSVIKLESLITLL